MEILITGINGMLGSVVASELSKDHKIIGLDLLPECSKVSDIEYYPCDISDENQARRITKKLSPDLIINCAAMTSVDGCEENQEKAKQINVDGTINMIKVGEEHKSQFIQISTDYVFDGTSGPYSEYDKTNPINYYGKTKLEAELALIQSSLLWTILRSNVLFSTSLTEKASFVSWVYQKLSANEKINIVNDQFCNPTSVHHLTYAIKKIIEAGAHGIYHYAGKDYLNRFEFALQIADTFNLDNRLINKTTTRALQQKAPRPYKSGLKTDKIENELGILTYYLKDTLQTMKTPGDADE